MTRNIESYNCLKAFPHFDSEEQTFREDDVKSFKRVYHKR